MKTRTICFSFLMAAAVIFSPDAYAGGKSKGKSKGKSHGNTEKQVERQTEWMKSNLNLSADQLSRIEALNKDAAAKLQALRDDKTKDEQAKSNLIADILKSLQVEIKIVLNPEQQTRYDDHCNHRHEHSCCDHKGHGKKGKGKAKGHHKCCHHHDD